MPINAETIPRYAPPTQAELEEMFAEPRHLCEGCAHCVDVVDRKNSRKGCLRLLSICVRSHDEDGDTDGEIIDGPVETCSGFARLEG